MECESTRLSDGASFEVPKTADPCTYCQCWAENNLPKKEAYHRGAVYFGLQFDGFTSTELFAPCTNLCFGAVQTSPRTLYWKVLAKWLSRRGSCFRYVLASRAPRCRKSQKYGFARGKFVACSRSQFDRLILSFWWTLRHCEGWRASLWWIPWLPSPCTSNYIVQFGRHGPFGQMARFPRSWSTSSGARGRTAGTRPCSDSYKTYRSQSHVSCK